MIKFLIVVSCAGASCPLGSASVKYNYQFKSAAECHSQAATIIRSMGFKPEHFKVLCKEQP
jgi:hypothetical protein